MLGKSNHVAVMLRESVCRITASLLHVHLHVCSFLVGCQPMKYGIGRRSFNIGKRRLAIDSKQTDLRRSEIVNCAILCTANLVVDRKSR
jgi:hypothetical protein